MALSHNIVSFNLSPTLCVVLYLFYLQVSEHRSRNYRYSLIGTQLGSGRGSIAWRSAGSRTFAPFSASTVLRWLSVPLSCPGAKPEVGPKHVSLCPPALGQCVTDDCLEAGMSRERPGSPSGPCSTADECFLTRSRPQAIEQGLFSRVLSSQTRVFFPTALSCALSQVNLIHHL